MLRFRISGKIISILNVLGSDEVFKEVNSFDRTLLEKLNMIEKLEEKEKQAFYSILDALITKKKLKDTLSNAIGLAS